MEAVREASFGKTYKRISAVLKRHGSDEAKNQFRQMEDLLFF